MLYYYEPGGSLFKISDMLCYGWPGYYDFCIPEKDGTFTFGNEQTRQGGVTLSSSWCNVEDGKTSRPATAEEYRQAVKNQLDSIEKYNPEYFEYIYSHMNNLNRAFLYFGASFDYKYPAIIAEQEARRRGNDKFMEMQDRGLFNAPVQAVFDFSTNEFKEL